MARAVLLARGMLRSLFLALTVAACSSSSSKPIFVETNSADPCTDSLENVNAAWNTPCPTRYTEGSVDLAGFCTSVPFLLSVSTAECGSTTQLWLDLGTHGKVCSYVASGQLVGARASDDIASFCEQSSSDLTAGDVMSSNNCYPNHDTHACLHDAESSDATTD
jgi:hypothetical protein